MKILKSLLIFIIALTFINCTNVKKHSSEKLKMEAMAENQHMYVIEREIPNASKLTAEELKAISQTSCSVLEKMGSEIQWMHSYVTDNKIYCVYLAPNEAMVREHAKLGGFPANSVSQVATIIDPKSAE